MTGRRRARGTPACVAATLVAAVLAAVAAPAAALLTSSTSTPGGAIATGNLAAPTSPGAVRGLCVPAVAAQIVVSWTVAARATGYQVRYGTTAGGPYPTTLTVPGGTTASRTVTGLAFGTTYHAVVVATVGQWTSTATSQVSVTTPSVACL